MRILTILVLFTAACSSSNNTTVDAPKATLDCASYCTAITANCTTTNLQYSDMGTCMASCNSYPKGTIADMGGDTLGCRLYHANAAKTDPNTHCVHAGPSGGGVCGMPCMGFCDITVAACPSDYANAGACATACAAFPTTPAYTANVQSGNSASCKIYHAQAASVTPSPHCMHVLPTGGPCQ
jgi:hypothetical protein